MPADFQVNCGVTKSTGTSWGAAGVGVGEVTDVVFVGTPRVYRHQAGRTTNDKGKPAHLTLGECQRFIDEDRATCEPVREGFALDILEDQVLTALGRFQPIDPAHIGVNESSVYLRLALEPREAIRVFREVRQQPLDRHLSIQLGIRSKIQHAHAASPKLAEDLE